MQFAVRQEDQLGLGRNPFQRRAQQDVESSCRCRRASFDRGGIHQGGPERSHGFRYLAPGRRERVHLERVPAQTPDQQRFGQDRVGDDGYIRRDESDLFVQGERLGVAMPQAVAQGSRSHLFGVDKGGLRVLAFEGLKTDHGVEARLRRGEKADP